RHCTTVGFGPQRPVQVVGFASALSAWAVPGGQCDGLVEKEQRRVAILLPLRHPSVSERQGTGDPSLVLMVAHHVAGAAAPVQATAIAHPCAAARDGDDLAQW